MLPIPPITQALMLICTAVLCVGYFVPQLGLWLALWPLGSGYFGPWQLVSYAFLHGDVLHLFFNMLALWMFGSELERLWGQRRYLQMLLASVLAAALMQMLVSLLLVSRSGPMVGASGAVFGLLLCYGVLFPNRTIMPLFPPIPMKARTFVMVFGALELFLGVAGDTGIAHFAHLGGMLGAWLMLLYWRGRLPFGRRR